MSTVLVKVMACPDRYEKDVNAVFAFLIQYINKRAPTPSVKVASFGQTRPVKWQKTSTTHDTFKGKVELTTYSREEYDSMSMAQCQQLYLLQKKAGLIKSKIPERSRALEARATMLEAKTKTVAMRAYLQIKSPKLITEIIQPLTEREVEPDRAVEILDS